ncbi:MAG: HPr kinase/phosphorylase [Paracoccaceae bacterium]
MSLSPDDDDQKGPLRKSGGPGSFEGQERIVHGSCVALGAAGCLILGPSGAGKSSLALQMMALGATLVADDRTVLRGFAEGGVIASCPAPIRRQIEARGIGILAAETQAQVPLVLVVDLAQQEKDRLPPQRVHSILGNDFALVWGQDSPVFAAALMQYLKGGRRA